MNEYTEVFEVSRQMHLRPFGNMVRTIVDYKRTYPNLEIKITCLEEDLEIDYKGVLSMLTYGVCFKRGKKLEFCASGNYEMKLLQSFIKELGSFVVE